VRDCLTAALRGLDTGPAYERGADPDKFEARGPGAVDALTAKDAHNVRDAIRVLYSLLELEDQHRRIDWVDRAPSRAG